MKQVFSSFFLFYLRFFAKLQLAKLQLLSSITKGKKITIIGITGSAGKSTLMASIEAILKPHFKVKTSSSGNSETGLPLSILNLKIHSYSFLNWLKIALLIPIKILTDWETYNYFLAEMGIDEPDEPKNMSYLLKIIRPQIGIILNISSMHSMQFDKTVSKDIKGKERLEKILKNLTQEKTKLLTSLPKDGLAIINSDDPHLKPLIKKIKTKSHTAGKGPKNTLVIKNVTSSPTLFSATYLYKTQKETLTIKDYALSESLAYTFALTILTGLSQGLDLRTCLANLQKNLVLPPSRSSVFKGVKNTTIIDSSYNSSPAATRSMLKLLSTAPSGKRVAILGDMRELGLQSPQEHRSLARIGAKSADYLVLVGPQMKDYFLPQLEKLSFPQKNIFHFSNYQTLNKKIKSIIKPNQTILIKGSQNTIFLEETVKVLLRKKELICRQSPFWTQTKKNYLQKIAN